jgi:FlgD Ig-like domain
MKKRVIVIFFFSLLFLSSTIFSQVLFSEDFESGTANAEWGLYRAGEELITAVPMGDVPKPLAGGGEYVGYLQDSDGSYTGAAIALAGEVTAANYTIEADVYCYVNNAGGSAYTGVAVYADSAQGTYIKLVADFDDSQRMRFYNNHLNFTTFQYSFHHQFDGPDLPNGIPTEDDWHHMKVEARTLNADTTAYWCYFDGVLLAGSPVYDTGDDRMGAGRFGLFSFQQGESGIAGYYDNVVVTEVASGTDDLFVDDFESGTANAEWGLYRAGEELLSAVPMGDAPKPLAGGGEYVGYLQDSDGSYTGAAIALAGEVTAANYSIEADVYCYVNNAGGSAYTGVAIHADSSQGTYIKLVADFDDSQRMRFYNNHLNFTTFQYSFHHQFDGPDLPNGIPTEDDWHHMKVEARTLNADTTAYWCYFDGELLAGSPVYDTGDDRMGAGRFGLFSFQQGESGIAGYFDNVAVKIIDPITSVNDNNYTASLPKEFALEQNYPNPFNPTTNISYRLKTANDVSLTIYDVLGSIVKTLVKQYQAPGYHTVTWNGKNDIGKKVNSGLYVYTLKAGDIFESKKMIMLK